jgi:hypothetical protein
MWLPDDQLQESNQVGLYKWLTSGPSRSEGPGHCPSQFRRSAINTGVTVLAEVIDRTSL